MELVETQALIFYADAKNTCCIMERNEIVNGEPTGRDGSLEIAAVNANGGCNEHVAMSKSWCFLFCAGAKNSAPIMEEINQL